MSMDAHHRSEVAYEVLDAGALLVGSSTLNNNMLPSVADELTYLKGLRPANLVGAAFGSYGWSGEAAGHVNAMLPRWRWRSWAGRQRPRYVPDAQTLKESYDLGRAAAERIVRNSGATDRPLPGNGPAGKLRTWR
jgi:flavorubredoxin